MNKIRYRYSSLEDFLISNPLTVDAQLDDGEGALFPVKGREIEATILFADVTAFSERTLELPAAGTLIFVNRFFTGITVDALRECPGIIDKYIGDEIMVIFSKEFGSDDPFVDAVQTARLIGDGDTWSFCPHIGIASGVVIVGFVGTPLKYSCSVFGSAVALAKRCAGIEPKVDSSASIIFPANLWADRSFEEIFPPRRIKKPDGSMYEQPHSWEIGDPRKVQVKNLPEIEVIEIAKTSLWVSSVEEIVREELQALKRAGLYRPKCVE